MDTTAIGKVVRTTRKSAKISLTELSIASNTGIRFIHELEHGKVTCQMGKALAVLNALGITAELTRSR